MLPAKSYLRVIDVIRDSQKICEQNEMSLGRLATNYSPLISIIYSNDLLIICHNF